MLHQFLSALGAVLLGGGILGFLFRSQWTHRLSRELEKFKSSLAADLFERQTKYAWLHTERAKILVQLYPLLSEVDGFCALALVHLSWAANMHLSIEAAEATFAKTSEKLTDLSSSLQKNEVLLGSELAGQLNFLAARYGEIVGVAIHREASSVPLNMSPVESLEYMRKQIAPLRQKVQETIQKMLGVEATRNSGLSNRGKN